MTKIVYNACYGGFGLSKAALLRWAEIKGFKLYPEKGKFGLTTYWRVLQDERAEPLEGEEWHRASQEERIAYNRRHAEQTVYDRDIPRDDPALAQVVEELGDAANGDHAKLRIEEIPTGGRYRIEEYDGFESVCRPETDQWDVAS